MGRSIILPLFGLLLFAFMGALTLNQYGYIGFFEAGVFENGATQFAGLDFLIMTLITLYLMWEDGRRRGRSPWPFVILTLIGGSAGPLLYLIFRGEKPSRG